MLELTGIAKDFAPAGRRRVRALDGISLRLERGSSLAVLGPNGAGKTTLLKVIATLILPDRGSVTLDGLLLGRDDERIKASVGLVTSAERSFYWRLTGRQNLAFFAALYGIERRKARERIDQLCRNFGVDYQDRRFDSYSTGMQQKFALMRALIHDPPLLLLDEPARSLDYSTAAELRSLVRNELVAKAGKTVIYTTHHMDEAADIAGRFLVMRSGRTAALGTLQALREAAGLPAGSLGECYTRLTEAA